MMTKHMLTIALSDEQMDTLSRVQKITLSSPVETVMAGIMLMLFYHDAINSMRERAQK